MIISKYSDIAIKFRITHIYKTIMINYDTSTLPELTNSPLVLNTDTHLFS